MNRWFPKFAGAFLGSFVGMCGAILFGLQYDEWSAARKRARKEATLRHPSSYQQSPYNTRRPR